MMLAAVETVTKADPVWESRRHNSDVAAQATAGEAVCCVSSKFERSERLQRTALSLQLPAARGDASFFRSGRGWQQALTELQRGDNEYRGRDWVNAVREYYSALESGLKQSGGPCRGPDA
jgi:hypothetical protein